VTNQNDHRPSAQIIDLSAYRPRQPTPGDTLSPEINAQLNAAAERIFGKRRQKGRVNRKTKAVRTAAAAGNAIHIHLHIELPALSRTRE
jgi:hypothetical protein